jgi:hypothetical protein
MNAKQLRTLIGSAVRIWPPERRILGRFRELPIAYYDWFVEPSPKPWAAVRLYNPTTGFFFDVGPDNVHEFRTPSTLVLKVQVFLTPWRRLVQVPLPDPRLWYAAARRFPLLGSG